MAIQNFLSGGYYGKLGATVGQRWKNKRTIRTYVVPANPRTPTQQANRGKFADAVTFAQMGLQMNYYCSLFEDPNFTKWNYRMKVARELKNAGLSGLDLIPLYPISFNPPVLLTEFTKATVTGSKHISFSAPDLALNVDRVLSLMFALYDENDSFLGYKLYLGYYYASNPGFVEVDVDNAAEINNHCFVRIISNDDENSMTDLIGSPRLSVGGSSIDIHTFDKTIRNVQKTSTGITITFAEPWKGVPTINEINFNVDCVVNGESVTLNGTGYNLFEDNGYCAVTFEYASSSNQMLPVFPVGSGISNLTVNYEGSSWQITIENATENYSDSDLARDFNSVASSVSRSGTTFSVVFGETLPSGTSNNLTLAIHAVKNGVWVNENVQIASITGNTITFEQAGASGANIYAFPSGATITLAGTITGNGVTYTADTQTAQGVSNADLNRTIVSTPTWNASSTSDITFRIPFGGTVAAATKYFNMVCSGRVSVRSAESQSFNVVGDGSNLVFTCTGSRKQYPMRNTGDLISVTAQSFTCNGVVYNLPAQNVALRNAITTSYYFEELDWTFDRDGGGSTGDDLQYLAMNAYIENASHDEIYESDVPAFSYVVIVQGSRNCVPSNSERFLGQDGVDLYISFTDNYAESQYADQTQDSSAVVKSATPLISVDGITYTFSDSWMSLHFPATILRW